MKRSPSPANWPKVAGGEPIRLTHEETDDYEPAFSPDGSRIAFRSERDGGAIYLTSALGGEPRLIAKDGRSRTSCSSARKCSARQTTIGGLPRPVAGRPSIPAPR
ncbi:MAG: hypothetical protein FJW20_03770 [Acidimicrobiia bacterium]|nr:hypothetical protein [Acidimicrobiia bacterium]